MHFIVTTHAGKPLREVLTAKNSLQIANVYAGLKRTKSALCYHPTRKRDRMLKTQVRAFLGKGETQ
jgi:hypothetical protein